MRALVRAIEILVYAVFALVFMVLAIVAVHVQRWDEAAAYALLWIGCSANAHNWGKE